MIGMYEGIILELKKALIEIGDSHKLFYNTGRNEA